MKDSFLSVQQSVGMSPEGRAAVKSRIILMIHYVS